MKKRFTTCFMFAVSLLMPFVLVSCGEEIQVPNNTNDGEFDPIGENATVFSGGKGDWVADDDGTCTSMDADRHFYWEPGDPNVGCSSGDIVAGLFE